MLYQPVPLSGSLKVWLRLGATVSWSMPVTSSVMADLLPATSVTVIPACDCALPSLNVNDAGVVTPGSAEGGVGMILALPLARLYQPVPLSGSLNVWLRLGATVSWSMPVKSAVM